ncbi:hypothetical protein H8356DRAFT_1424326 [Neocallimastix lanati (nom. inval.)]|nr:hypothetical protein H8356DRAFT_1424326 [Neocallimastix sp. JGI-2020a]
MNRKNNIGKHLNNPENKYLIIFATTWITFGIIFQLIPRLSVFIAKIEKSSYVCEIFSHNSLNENLNLFSGESLVDIIHSIFKMLFLSANIIEDDCPERCPCCGRENINPRLKYPYNISIYMDISYTLGFTSI